MHTKRIKPTHKPSATSNPTVHKSPEPAPQSGTKLARVGEPINIEVVQGWAVRRSICSTDTLSTGARLYLVQLLDLIQNANHHLGVAFMGRAWASDHFKRNPATLSRWNGEILDKGWVIRRDRGDHSTITAFTLRPEYLDYLVRSEQAPARLDLEFIARQALPKVLRSNSHSRKNATLTGCAVPESGGHSCKNATSDSRKNAPTPRLQKCDPETIEGTERRNEVTSSSLTSVAGRAPPVELGSIDDDEIRVLIKELQRLRPTADPALARALMKVALELDEQVSPREVAVLLNVTLANGKEPRSNGYFLTAVKNLMESPAYSVLQGLRNGRERASELMGRGMPESLRVMGAAWEGLCEEPGA